MSGQLLCGPVAAASLLLLYQGAAASQVRDNSQMCSLTHRPVQVWGWEWEEGLLGSGSHQPWTPPGHPCLWPRPQRQW